MILDSWETLLIHMQDLSLDKMVVTTTDQMMVTDQMVVTTTNPMAVSKGRISM